jgi:hypothetical protein
MAKGKLFSETLSGYQLCSPTDDKVESCPTRRWHGCGGDGDEENCMSRKYINTKEIEKAKQDLLSRLPGANGNPKWTLKDAIAYAPVEVAEWFVDQFGDCCVQSDEAKKQ